MLKIEVCMACSLPEYTNIKTWCICHQMVYNLCPYAKVVEQHKRKCFHSRDRRLTTEAYKSNKIICYGTISIACLATLLYRHTIWYISSRELVIEFWTTFDFLYLQIFKWFICRVIYNMKSLNWFYRTIVVWYVILRIVDIYPYTTKPLPLKRLYTLAFHQLMFLS